MSTVNLDEILDFAVEIAHQAGKAITEGSETRFKNAGKFLSANSAGFDEKKNTADLVTETDQNTEKLVYEAIQKRYPDHQFIGEESWAAGKQAELTDAPTWIIDPIDGTTNFVKGFPFVCISIGFVYKSEPVIGVIFAPFLGYLYAAKKGGGAFMTSPLHPERRSLPLVQPPPLPSFKQALIAFEWGSDRSKEVMAKKTRTFERLTGDAAAGVEGGEMALGVRSIGSAALNFAHVASGSLDLYWEIGCWAWDVCAGMVIAKEA
ncbi:inositol-phosphate phosphatase [Malassezia yamatoensis]|uniref:Inositol-1-monophosphatase n=1 Tax=Malassezia yamatoensis TaxID=253288 RepID=A0AAJ5YQC0_9BASI|nr:inositol-phosphate phosphatase [Malassezia yamatoensis]